MNTCYGRDWSCAESMAAATRDLLQAGGKGGIREVGGFNWSEPNVRSKRQYVGAVREC